MSKLRWTPFAWPSSKGQFSKGNGDLHPLRLLGSGCVSDSSGKINCCWGPVRYFKSVDLQKPFTIYSYSRLFIFPTGKCRQLTADLREGRMSCLLELGSFSLTSTSRRVQQLNDRRFFEEVKEISNRGTRIWMLLFFKMRIVENHVEFENTKRYLT